MAGIDPEKLARMPASDIVSPEKTGWMVKQSGGRKRMIRKNWRRRWFILKNYVLFYYKSTKAKAPSGFIVLNQTSEARAENVNHGKYGFVVSTDRRWLYCSASSDREREDWIDTINQTVSDMRKSAMSQDTKTHEKEWTVDPATVTWQEVFDSPPPSSGLATVAPTVFAVMKTNRKGLLAEQKMMFELDLDRCSLAYWICSSATSFKRLKYRKYPVTIVRSLCPVPGDSDAKLRIVFSATEHSDPHKTFAFRFRELRERFCEGIRLAQQRLATKHLEDGEEEEEESAVVRGPGLVVSKETIGLVRDLQVAGIGSPNHLDTYVGSWNMGEAPPPADLSSWLPSHEEYDLIVIGVQEAQYEPREGYRTTEQDWFGTVKLHLGSEYVPLVEQSLWIMRMGVYIRASLRHFVHTVEYGSVATGVAGVAGNKGGLGASFWVDDTSFCFVSCHLAARPDANRLRLRNSNVQDIIGSLRFGRKGIDLNNDFHHTFFFGDLNYRTDDTVPRAEVLQKIEEGKWEDLLRWDQLTAEMAGGRVFHGFTALQPHWRPSYRYNRGDRTYSEEKMRHPSYTDRIVYRSLPHVGKAEEGFFLPFDDIMTSDHSPIGAHMLVPVRHPYIPRDMMPRCLESCCVEFAHIETAGVISAAPEGSSVYIRFRAPWLEEYPATPVAPRGVIARWSDESVPLLRVFIPERTFVERSAIWLCIRHRDVVKGDADLGQAVLALEPASHGTHVKFRVDIVHRGIPRGFITGEYLVFWCAVADQRRPRRMVFEADVPLRHKERVGGDRPVTIGGRVRDPNVVSIDSAEMLDHELPVYVTERRHHRVSLLQVGEEEDSDGQMVEDSSDDEEEVLMVEPSSRIE